MISLHITSGDIAALIRSLSKTAGKPHFTSAVIAAAGSGTRMGSGQTKQTMELCGMPVIARTLLAFERCGEINEIVIAARADEIPMYETLRKSYNINKLTAVVEGGDTRQESVLRGFERISDKAEFVAIHDGEMPCHTGDNIVCREGGVQLGRRDRRFPRERYGQARGFQGIHRGDGRPLFTLASLHAADIWD